MPKFTYQAINANGNSVSGELESESLDAARNFLSSRGYIPTKVSLKAGVTSGFSFRKLQAKLTPISVAEMIIFTKQLRTMFRAGVPIIRLLDILENQTENLNLQWIINAMSQDIKQGASLYEAFSKHPKAFSPLFCSMIRAGEVSGALPDVLDRLIYIIEHDHKIKSDVKSALQYPIIVFMLLGVAFFVLLTFVIPKFIGIFTKAGLELPLPTRICLGMYHFFSDFWVLILGLSLGVVIVVMYYLSTDYGKYLRDRFLLRLPVFGQLFMKAAMSRFASIFAILQSSGVPILDSMKILSGTIGNHAIGREFDRIVDRLGEGRGIAGPLKMSPFFTPIVINMVAIGEETGNLEQMLSEISEHYDSELEYAMKKLSEAIGPVLTVGLAAVIGFFSLAIFLPMWDMAKMVK